MSTDPDSQRRPAHRRRGRLAPLTGPGRTRVVASAVLGSLLAGGAAYAVSSWSVGVDAGSVGEGQSAAISNVTITATATPAAGNLLYPGGTGDVVVSIANPNPYPVTITAVNLPTSTTYATGFSNSALSSAVAGCTATNSLVAWNFATGTSGTSHTLTSALTVAANGQANNPLVVTLTSTAAMGNASPAACAATWFSLPSLTGITASGGAASVTTSPATSGWTS